MSIQLTEDQWANVVRQQSPVVVSDPSHCARYVLVRTEDYERFKSLFEEDPVSSQERAMHLQQFGRRAGWDDPEMNIYDDLDPRNKS